MELALFFFMLTSAFSGSRPETIVYGKFSAAQTEIKLEDITSSYLLKEEDKILTTTTGVTGDFAIRPKPALPGYYRLGCNILFLKHGDDLKVSIDRSDPKLSTFEGVGSSVNIFLKDTPIPQEGSYLDDGKNLPSAPQDAIDEIINSGKIRNIALNDLKGTTHRFRKLERARIKADVVNSILSVPRYLAKLNMAPDSSRKYLLRFKALSSPLLESHCASLENPDYLQLDVYKILAKYLIARSKEKGLDKASLHKVEDWIKADSLIQKMKGMKNRETIEDFSTELDSIKFSKYRRAAKKIKTELLEKLGEGKVKGLPAPTEKQRHDVPFSSSQ